MTARPRIEEVEIEGWLAIAVAMGFTNERSARRWASHKDPARRLRVRKGPGKRVATNREWIRDWMRANSTTNKVAA